MTTIISVRIIQMAITIVTLIPGCCFGQTAPTPRNNASIAYDPVKKVVLVYGGSAHTRGAIPMRDSAIWEWNGITWNKRTIAPSLRADHGFAYDIKNQRILIAGGAFSYNATKSIEYDDTWAFQNQQWSKVTSNKILKRFHGAFTYAQNQNSFILFSGYTPETNELLKGVWALSRNNWIHINTQNEPPARFLNSVFYDPKNDAIILIGGADLDNKPFHEMWMLKENKWTVLNENVPALIMNSHGATAMGETGNYVIVHSSFDTNTCETWIWDGAQKSWKKVKGPHPRPRNNTSIVYDDARKCVVMFGGETGVNSTNEVWELPGGQSGWIKRF